MPPSRDGSCQCSTTSTLKSQPLSPCLHGGGKGAVRDIEHVHVQTLNLLALPAVALTPAQTRVSAPWSVPRCHLHALARAASPSGSKCLPRQPAPPPPPPPPRLVQTGRSGPR